MSLLEAFSKEFVMLTKTYESDGAGGRSNVVYTEGTPFYMPQAHNGTQEQRKAEQDGTSSTYAFLPDKSMTFNYHDIFKRVEDGQVFRVVNPSGEDITPSVSALNLTLIYAEKWELPE